MQNSEVFKGRMQVAESTAAEAKSKNAELEDQVLSQDLDTEICCFKGSPRLLSTKRQGTWYGGNTLVHNYLEITHFFIQQLTT